MSGLTGAALRGRAKAEAGKAAPGVTVGIQALAAALGVLVLPAPGAASPLAVALTIGALVGAWAIALGGPATATRSPPAASSSPSATRTRTGAAGREPGFGQAAENGCSARPGWLSAADTNLKADVVRQAATLRQIARWRASGMAIPPPLLERLRDENLTAFMRTLNTRQADALAGAPMQHIVAFLLTGRPLTGVPGRCAGADRGAPPDAPPRRR